MSYTEPVREAVMRPADLLGAMSRQRMSSTLHWRSMVNVLFMTIDAVMFAIAESGVLGGRGETLSECSLRLDHPVMISICLICSALVWVACLGVAGIYHRHVMGDGYRVNLLIVQAGVLCWLVLCAACFLLDLDLSLAGLNLTVVIGAGLTMIGRMVARPIIQRQRGRGMFSYNTAVVGSPEGILETLRFLGQRQQLNYNPTVICPVRWDAAGERIAADHDTDRLLTDLENLSGGGSTVFTDRVR